jgi:hypothetical protein
MMHSTLVDGTDLAHWADRRDAESDLPRLLRRLIQATVPQVERIALPSDEGVLIGGWDGVVQVTGGTAYVPNGLSVWELGTNKAVKGKADDDYEKRTIDPLGLDPKTTTFVFVTPRRWGGKDKWIAAKRAEGKWGDVRAYDADDIAAWLEDAPAVHTWLSLLLGKRPDGSVDIAHFWEDWSAATRPPTSAALVIAGRQEAMQDVQERLRGAAALISLRADSREEALAFFIAAMQQLPVEERTALLARCLIVEDTIAWRQLTAGASPLVLFPTLDDRRTIGAAVAKGHHVLVPLGNDDAATGTSIDLTRPHRDDVRSALSEMGVSEAQLDDMATLGRRSSSALRRRLAIDASVLSPRWSEPAEARALLPALLAGKWDDTNQADRDLLARLAGTDYAILSGTFVRWSNEPDPPVRRVGNTWMLTSPEDAWPLLARFLSGDELQRFEAAVLATLGEADPRFALPAKERRLAGIRGIGHTHSADLRTGLAETLAQMAARSDAVRLADARSGQDWVDRIARQIFAATTDFPRWGSLAPFLPILAEASPDIFLGAVDRALTGEQPVLAQLFNDHGDDFDDVFDTPLHTGLLWALETLAWSPDYIGRATALLAALARLDPGGRFANRPRASLHEIFLCWHPNTTAPPEQRLRVLDLLCKREPEVAWATLLGLLPSTSEVSTPTSTPRWRDWDTNSPAEITTLEFFRAVSEIARRLLEDVGLSGSRWRDLISRVENLPRDEFDAVAKRIDELDMGGFSSADREVLRESLRALVARHTEFASAEWAIPGDLIRPFAAAYDRCEPVDPVAKHAWLFSDRPDLIAPGGDDWEARAAALSAARIAAVRELQASGGIPLLLSFAAGVTHPVEVGFALGRGDVLADQEAAFLAQTLGAISVAHRVLALGYVQGRVSTEGRQWLETLAESDVVAGSGPQGKADGLCCLPFDERTWDRVEALDEETRRLYWSQVSISGRGELAEIDHERALSLMVAHGALANALRFVALYTRKNQARVPVSSVANLLRRATEQSAATTIDWPQLSHEVASLIDVLAATEASGADDSALAELARLEWLFLPLLEFRRSPRALHRALASDPAFFAEVLGMVYRSDDDVPKEHTEDDAVRARLGFTLLQSWRRVPAIQDDGSINAADFREWVVAAHDLAHADGRGAIGDQQIGQVLAYAPAAADGAWPHEAVRSVLEELRSEDLELGLIVGVANSRGFTSRAIGAGGSPERALASTYRAHAQQTKDQWPRITRVLEEIARDFDEHARRMDTMGDKEQDSWR